ncbi:MAG: sorbosone dehydrogenase family protein [Acidobacteria bacterium]|nr:sorbosone dehydrogenase family protein [Acidobacteriota bacterium]
MRRLNPVHPVILSTLLLVGCGGSGVAVEQAAWTPPELRHYEFLAEDLKPGPDSNNGPQVVARPEGAELLLPPGFAIELFASGEFKRPRWLALAPNGDVFLSDSAAGAIFLLRDTDGNGVSDVRFAYATGLNKPFGLAFHDGSLFVGNTDAVVRFDYRDGDTAARAAPVQIVDLPGRGYNEHWTRNVAVSPDGQFLFVTVGSETNVEAEADPRRAAILRMKLDGSEMKVYASGLRNPVGMAFHPSTKALWSVVQERDRLGDDLVPDYLAAIREDAFYGWPFSYLGKTEDPRRKGERPELVATAIAPDVLFQAHSSALGLAFYDGTMFPEEYRGDAFVAFHGSWNRSKRTGYKIVRVKFEDGRPVGGYDDFCVGWMLGEDVKEVWGRPVGLLVQRDGSLLVVDDGANCVWRIKYEKS